MQPLVSVVIPTYGRPVSLERALRSVLGQDYPNLELIVVDDNKPGSRNRVETAEVVERIREDWPQIIYQQRASNGGGSRARNDGIGAASGEFVTFLDDDDEYFSNKVSAQVAHVLSDDLDISLCAMQAVRNGRLVSYEGSLPRGENLREFLLFGNAFTPMIMVRRELLVDVGGFPISNRFQDHLLMLRLLERHPRVGILREPLYRFHMHDGERVTFSERSVEALQMKHMEEARLSVNLPENERNLLAFRQRKELLWVHARHGAYLRKLVSALAGAKNVKEALAYISAAARGVAGRAKLLRTVRAWLQT